MPASERPALSFWSPLPPARSGVADYSAALLPHLARDHDVAAVVDPQAGAHEVAGVRQIRPEAAAADAEAIPIYQMGNNAPFHEFVYQAARRRKGILVLHDACLAGFHFDLHCRRGRTQAFLEELEYCEGAAAATSFWRSLRTGVDAETLTGFPMVRRLVEGSLAVIVHSRALRDEIRRRYGHTHVHHLTLGADVGPEERDVERLPGELRVGAFGIVYESKRIDVVLRAVASLVGRIPRLTLDVVGPIGHEPLRERLSDLVRALGLGPYVSFTGHVPAEEFDRRLRECDVVVNLRYPSHGEASAAMMRAFGAGKPVIASDIPSFAEFAPDYCVRVPVGDGEHEALAGALLTLARDPSARAAMGTAARRMVRATATWPLVSARYREIIDDVAARTMAGGVAGS